MARKHPIPPKTVRHRKRAATPGRNDALLDEALEQSFPASDPPSMVQPDDGHDDGNSEPADPERPRHRGDRP